MSSFEEIYSLDDFHQLEKGTINLHNFLYKFCSKFPIRSFNDYKLNYLKYSCLFRALLSIFNLQKSNEDKSRFLNINQDVFFYYSKSANKRAGYGVNEQNLSGIPYTALNNIQDWRKILSNFYIQNNPLICPDTSYSFASVEHFYQGSKFKSNINFYSTFSLNVNDYSTADQAKSAGGKTGKGRRPEFKNISMDSNFNFSEVMFQILLQKFSLDEVSKNVLMCTGNAILMHSMGRGAPNEPQISLMIIREIIRFF